MSGSDDHSGINPGQTWTEFVLPEGRNPEPNDLVDAIRARATVPAGAHGGPVTLAHAMVKLLYDGQRLAAHGLLYEDVMIETADVKLALKRMPKELMVAREQRLKRAMMLDTQQKTLPPEVAAREARPDSH